MRTISRYPDVVKANLERVRRAKVLDLTRSLPGFFRERVTVQGAEEEIKHSLAAREARFLALARERVYENPFSPYLRLLQIAGCDYADLNASVHQHGLEGTLDRLAQEGVYLTSDEYKGKREIVRGGQSFRASPSDFERADGTGLSTQSSGTRNDPVRSVISLDWLAARTMAMGVFFAAHDLFKYSHGLYDAILPGSAVNHILINAKLGKVTDRWFARKIPAASPLEGGYHLLSTYLIVLAGRRHGPGFPRPEFLEISQLDRIVRWVQEKQQQGSACFITTVASSAARIARVAWEMGVGLEGTKFSVAGEPFTAAKEQLIARVGASATTRYAYGGALNVGFGCADSLHRDEVHVNQHLLAVLSHPTPLPGDGPPIHPLLCTTVHPLAPRFLLNVQNGDYATLQSRDCGCALGRVGLTQHLHHIRSFEKFASEGMNYFYLDLFQVLEEDLPAEFGGSAGDYQLAEEEDVTGQTHLTLRIHPGVGPLDEGLVLARLREALAQGPRDNRFMARVWEGTGTLRVKREAPVASPRGKLLPLHLPPTASSPAVDSE